MNLHRTLERFERALLRGFNFVGNVRYYWIERRHGLRDAIELARATLP